MSGKYGRGVYHEKKIGILMKLGRVTLTVFSWLSPRIYCNLSQALTPEINWNL